jgi:hypothetical protein
MGRTRCAAFGAGKRLAWRAGASAARGFLAGDGRAAIVVHRAPPQGGGSASAGAPGNFLAELWRHDVAELFIADPASGRYFEFNLAPNGAWWSCEFTAPRVVPRKRTSRCRKSPRFPTWLRTAHGSRPCPFRSICCAHGWISARRLARECHFRPWFAGPKFLTAADLGGEIRISTGRSGSRRFPSPLPRVTGDFNVRVTRPLQVCHSMLEKSADPRRFQIEDLIIQDASGVVFRALDTETGRTVALRRFFPFGAHGGGLLDDEQTAYNIALDRLAGLNHPRCARSICGGCDPVDGIPFIATEWIEGDLLEPVLQRGPLPTEAAVELITQALEVCELLSHVLAEEAVWVETDPQHHRARQCRKRPRVHVLDLPAQMARRQ